MKTDWHFSPFQTEILEKVARPGNSICTVQYWGRQHYSNMYNKFIIHVYVKVQCHAILNKQEGFCNSAGSDF